MKDFKHYSVSKTVFLHQSKMSSKLFNGVCSGTRYDKCIEIVMDKDKKLRKVGKAPKLVATESEALASPALQRYFLRQRAQINAYYQQAKKASRKQHGDIVRDIKSLLVPYLFAMHGRKPNTASPGDFKKFSGEMANANKYFINLIGDGFHYSLKPTKRRNRIIPFDNQLDNWWIRNKVSQLSGWMALITNNPKSIYDEAIKAQESSILARKAKEFKRKKDELKGNKEAMDLVEGAEKDYRRRRGEEEEEEDDDRTMYLDEYEDEEQPLTEDNKQSTSSSSTPTPEEQLKKSKKKGKN